jgi:hypothetical protein
MSQDSSKPIEATKAKDDVVSEDKRFYHIAIQNNYNLQDINIRELSELASVDKDLANRYISLMENTQKQTYQLNMELIELEKREQKTKITELPYIRKYTFRGQIFALLLLYQNT